MKTKTEVAYIRVPTDVEDQVMVVEPPKKNRCCFVCKRLVLFILAASIMTGVIVYYRYFKRAPVSDIMAQNKASFVKAIDEYEYYEDLDHLDDSIFENLTPAKSALIWNKFITDNKYVAIGKIFDKCEGDDRIHLGRTILLVDTVEGGVTSKTFLNFSLSHEVNDGVFNIEVKYNGKDLYSNHWAICTLDVNDPDRQVYCPLKKGVHKYQKVKKIPNFLPKGTYYTKVWITDQDSKIIGCAFAEFTL